MKPIIALFEKVVQEHQGTSLTTQQLHGKTFLRAVTSTKTTISQGDDLQGGVAVMADEQEATIAAFSLRLVCSNGMIAPVSHFYEKLSLNPFLEESLEKSLHTALHTSEEILQKTTEQFRHAKQIPMSPAMVQQIEVILDSLSNLIESLGGGIRLSRIRMLTMRRVRRSESLFDAVNAMTDLARDLPDPSLRWQMEAIAGDCLMGALNSGPNPPKPLVAQEPLPLAVAY
ncbi:MAG: hypothetical protein EAZ89_09525 [Bacteroidetes bacterium]|nr:MAG: hypothetical protein EAZ89_09525 [Bacteroidota bacterium]